jgi:hypothetical protein
LTPRALLLVVMEHALVLVAVVVAAALRLGYSDGLFDLGLLWRGMLIATVLQISLHYGDLYDLRTVRDRRDLVIRLLQALGATSVVLAVLYYWVPRPHHRSRRVRGRVGADRPGDRRMARRI